MEEKILRKLFLGFIQVHILYYTSKGPVFGSWMIEELKRHGYEVSAGTLYPLLHEMHRKGLLKKQEQNVGGRIRKYYIMTPVGAAVLDEARCKALELVKELTE